MSQWDEVDRLIAAIRSDLISERLPRRKPLELLLAALDAARAERCVWRENGESMWATACGREWSAEENVSPADVGATHCQFCGCPIEAIPFTEEVPRG